MSDPSGYEKLLDLTADDVWRVQDELLKEIEKKVGALTQREHGLPYVIAQPLDEFLTHLRIRLALEYGKITPNKARAMLGVPEWAQ